MYDNNSKIKTIKEQFHYFKPDYDTKGRFCSYWHQINEVMSLKPKKVLEMGIGNGFVARYLKEKGLDVITLDVVQELKPDATGSVLSIPFASESFDIATCFEVLEHLPYSDFKKALEEIRRVSKKHVILSLPDHTSVYRFDIELPRIKPIKKLIPHPFPRPAPHKYDGVHYWIIGRTNYPLKKIKLDIERTDFKVIKTYRVFEFYGHRFFLLEKF